MAQFKPLSFIIQWHITERCNWRCEHCYQEGYDTKEMSLAKMDDILWQYISLLKKWRIPKRLARIQITGGEPMIRNDFFEFLQKINQYDEFFYWILLSNGSLLDANSAASLKKLGINSFQLSLEGLEETNDSIRPKGSFQKTVKAIDILNKAGIPARVSLTLTRQNMTEIRGLASTLNDLQARSLAVRRIAPFGQGSNLKDTVLQPMELKELYRLIQEINKQMIREKKKFRVSGGCENAIFNDEIEDVNLMTMERCALLEGKILTIMPNGDVLICRRCPIKIGNLNEKSLEEIYYSPHYAALRDKKDVPLECYFCNNLKNCAGGAKCVTYALTGKTAPDIQCWKLFNDLEEATKYISQPNLCKKISLAYKNLKRN